MGRIQFVVESDPLLIDRSADGYILANKLVYRLKNRALLEGKYRTITALPTEQEYLETWRYIGELADRAADYYGPRMNEKLCLSLDREQWRRIIGTWARPLLFDAYDCYRRIKSAGSEELFLVYRNENVQTVYKDESELEVMEQGSESFRTLLYNVIFERLGYETITCTPDQNIIREQRIRSLKEGVSERFIFETHRWRNRLARAAHQPRCIVKKLWHTASAADAPVITADYSSEILVFDRSLPSQAEEEIVRRGGGRISFVDHELACADEILASTQVDLRGREDVFSGFAAENEFERLVDPLMGNFASLTVFEALPQLWEKAKQTVKGWNCRKIYGGGYGFGALCEIAAREKGCLLCDVQHSAVYGNVFCLGFNQYKYFDRFCTWGWRAESASHCDIRPVAMNRMPRAQLQSVRKVKKKILLVNNLPEFGNTGRGWSFQDQTEQLLAFIDNLSEENRKKLVVRSRGGSGESDLRAICRAKYPCVRFEHFSEKTFSDSLMESELLVCGYYGSPHLESLTLGRPFVMFNGVRIAVQNHGIQSLLDRLREAGIYVEDGAECARHINEHKDWDAWLLSPENKRLLEEYKTEMTGGDDRTELWLREFLGD